MPPVVSPYANAIEVRPSTIQAAGRGLFARWHLPRGVLLGEYLGDKLSREAFELVDQDGSFDRSKRHCWYFAVQNGAGRVVHTIDASVTGDDNKIKFINTLTDASSERYNVTFRVRKSDLRVLAYTAYEIQAHEELFAWYGVETLKFLHSELSMLPPTPSEHKQEPQESDQHQAEKATSLRKRHRRDRGDDDKDKDEDGEEDITDGDDGDGIDASSSSTSSAVVASSDASRGIQTCRHCHDRFYAPNMRVTICSKTCIKLAAQLHRAKKKHSPPPTTTIAVADAAAAATTRATATITTADVNDAEKVEKMEVLAAAAAKGQTFDTRPTTVAVMFDQLLLTNEQRQAIGQRAPATATEASLTFSLLAGLDERDLCGVGLNDLQRKAWHRLIQTFIQH